LVVYYDPLTCHKWDAAEVARRWTEAFPPRASPDHPQDLEDLQAVLAAMAYVDLNPVRAKICEAIDGYAHTSAYRRLQHLENSPEKLQELMRPLVSGISNPFRPKSQLMILEDYIRHLRMLSPFSESHMTDEKAIWLNRVASLRKRQRAYGLLGELQNCVGRHGWRRIGDAMA
jgi:hypothetical protein